jgi:hypothetical protein
MAPQRPSLSHPFSVCLILGKNLEVTLVGELEHDSQDELQRLIASLRVIRLTEDQFTSLLPDGRNFRDQADNQENDITHL